MQINWDGDSENSNFMGLMMLECLFDRLIGQQ